MNSGQRSVARRVARLVYVVCYHVYSARKMDAKQRFINCHVTTILAVIDRARSRYVTGLFASATARSAAGASWQASVSEQAAGGSLTLGGAG